MPTTLAPVPFGTATTTSPSFANAAVYAPAGGAATHRTVTFGPATAAAAAAAAAPTRRGTEATLSTRSQYADRVSLPLRADERFQRERPHRGQLRQRRVHADDGEPKPAPRDGGRREQLVRVRRHFPCHGQRERRRDRRVRPFDPTGCR